MTIKGQRFHGLNNHPVSREWKSLAILQNVDRLLKKKLAHLRIRLCHHSELGLNSNSVPRQFPLLKHMGSSHLNVYWKAVNVTMFLVYNFYYYTFFWKSCFPSSLVRNLSHAQRSILSALYVYCYSNFLIETIFIDLQRTDFCF